MANGNFGGGNGRWWSPYLIEDAADLDALRYKDPDEYEYYEQVSDIYLGSWGEFEPIDGFWGWFDGRGHGIYDLKVRTDKRGGLFNWTGGNLSNIHLYNVDIEGDREVGALAGQLVGPSGQIMRNCSSSGRVSGGSVVGGLVGYAFRRDFYDCYSTCDVTSEYGMAGGLIGQMNGDRWYYDVKNCWASGNVKSVSSIGGLIGYSRLTELMNCYALNDRLITTKEPNLYKVDVPYEIYWGDIVGQVSNNVITNCAAYSGMDFEELRDPKKHGSIVSPVRTADWTVSRQPTSSEFSSNGWDFSDIWTSGGGYPHLQDPPPHPTPFTGFSGGSGTEGNPYRIANKQDLYNIRHNPKAHYVQVADIDFQWSSWETIPYFFGSIDGSEYAIKNIRYAPTPKHIGEFYDVRAMYSFFGLIELANISNLTIEGIKCDNAPIDDDGNTVWIINGVGHEVNDCTFQNIHITDFTINSDQSRVYDWLEYSGMFNYLTNCTFTDCSLTNFTVNYIKGEGECMISGIATYTHTVIINNVGVDGFNVNTSAVDSDSTGTIEISGFAWDMSNNWEWDPGELNVMYVTNININNTIKNIEKFVFGGYSTLLYVEELSNAYTSGTVDIGQVENGEFEAYGFAKFIDWDPVTINNSYSAIKFKPSSTASIYPFTHSGGDDPYYELTLISCYADTEISPGVAWAENTLNTEKSTKEMRKETTFAGWDFDSVWKIIEGRTYPLFVLPEMTFAQCERMPMGGFLRI